MRVLTSTDHKVIGKLYLATSSSWFLIGGLMAMLIRSQLAFPGQQVVNDERYNQLFTMHGTIMLLLFANTGLRLNTGSIWHGRGHQADARRRQPNLRIADLRQ